MRVRRLDEIIGSDDEVDDGRFVSRRFVLSRDGMGHSVHETTVRAGNELPMQYRNHLESVYCIEGEGEVEDRSEGGKWAIRPGTLYALDNHQAHTLRAHTDLKLLCVFTPPLVGPETHDEYGSYPLLDEDGNVIRH